MRPYACLWCLFLALSACTTRPAPAAPAERLASFSFPVGGGQNLAWDQDETELKVAGQVLPFATLFLHVFQPDCLACQAQARALQALSEQQAVPGVVMVGLAHRGDAADVLAFRKATGATYPMAVGTGSEWAGVWGADDPMYLVDREGRVVYSQVGYAAEDLMTWAEAAANLANGERPRVTGPDRAQKPK